jgi:hypothetical protein
VRALLHLPDRPYLLRSNACLLERGPLCKALLYALQNRAVSEPHNTVGHAAHEDTFYPTQSPGGGDGDNQRGTGVGARRGAVVLPSELW